MFSFVAVEGRGVQPTHQPAKTDLTQPNLLGWVGF